MKKHGKETRKFLLEMFAQFHHHARYRLLFKTACMKHFYGFNILCGFHERIMTLLMMGCIVFRVSYFCKENNLFVNSVLNFIIKHESSSNAHLKSI